MADGTAETAPASIATAPIQQAPAAPAKVETFAKPPPQGKPPEAKQEAKPVEPAKPPEPPKPSKFKRTLKVNGQEQEVEATEDELWASHRQNQASQKRFEEAAQIRREAEQERQQLRQMRERLAQSPLQTLVDAGYTPEQALAIVEQEAVSQMERLKMTPEQRELEQLRYERQQIQQQRMTEQQQRETAQQEEMFKKALDSDSSELLEAMKVAGWPTEDWALEIFAKDFYTAKEQGIDLSREELVSAATRTRDTMIEAALNGVKDDDDLIEKFPKVAQRIASALRKRYEARRTGGYRPPTQVQAPQQQVQKAPLNDLQMDVIMGLRPAPAGFQIPRGWEAYADRIKR